MGMFLGNINPSAFYFGNKTINKILFLENIVWEKNGGEVDDLPYLCFTAEEAGSTISMSKSRTPPTVYLETSPTGEEGSWTEFIVGSTTITLANVGDKVYFRAKRDNLTFSTGGWAFQKFLVSKKTKLTGSISTILTTSGEEIYNAQQYWFNCLFANSYITTVPSIFPATTLAYGCYRYMFDSCKYLTQAPALPATELDDDCYAGMFLNCTSLTQAPALPATELKYNCYERMFEGCTSLTQAPELKITRLAGKCIEKMFYNSGISSFTVDMTACTTVPSLPASNLFSSSGKPYTVLVPASLYDEWIQATNWSTIASNIQAV